MPLLRPMNPPLTDWRGKTVWLVGASTGIGLACATELHARGARVILSARKQADLQAFVQAHEDSIGVPVDVSKPLSLQAAAEYLHRTVGTLDCVVYCAGHYNAMDSSQFDLPDAERHMDVNYAGALRVLAHVLPPMLTRGTGHISVIASVAGYRGLPHSLAYGPTKAALIHLAEVLYLDLHPKGIGVSLINPGFVQTPLTAHNTFHMPALLTPTQAAHAIIQGWARGAFEIHFPKRFTLWLRVLRVLPYRLYFALVRRITQDR